MPCICAQSWYSYCCSFFKIESHDTIIGRGGVQYISGIMYFDIVSYGLTDYSERKNAK